MEAIIGEVVSSCEKLPNCSPRFIEILKKSAESDFS
jgi:hypothetical protein